MQINHTRRLRFAAACLISGALLFSGISCSKKNGTDFTAGTYSATEKGLYGDITVSVTVSGSRIEKIDVQSRETENIGKTAMDKMSKQIVQNQNIAVDVVTGATISSKAYLAAVEKALTSAGGGISALKHDRNARKGPDETITTKIAVVGGGAAGTAAALQAAVDGRDVVLVEMTSAPAGQGTMAGGLFGNNSRQQKQRGEVADDKWLYDQFVNTSNYTANGGLIAKVVHNSGDTVDWLIDNGCKLVLAHAATGGVYEHKYTQPAATIHGYVEGGVKGITALHESIVKHGGRVLYSTKAQKLLTGNGKITGITCTKDDGGTLTVKAEAVILATGGFGGNLEKVQEVFGKDFGKSRIATNIGTGIEMAKSAGGDAGYSKAIMMNYGVSRNGVGGNLNTALNAPWLHVDVDGNRFMNEESFSLEAIKYADALRALPQHAAYEIFDQSLVSIVAAKGTAGILDIYTGKLATDPDVFIEVGHTVDTKTRAEASHKPVDLTADLAQAVADGKITAADSIEELAQKLGMTSLAATVNRYNELAKAGKDTDQFKSAQFLRPISGKVYAVKVTPGNFLGTLGGVRINDRCEVVTPEGKAIPGLYDAGAETSGAYGNSYVYFEGGTLGYAYGTGRIAAKSAEAYVK